MSLVDLIGERRQAILKRWQKLILDSYPPDTVRFLEQEGDRFLNPVGHTIFQGTEVIFDELLRGERTEPLSQALDGMLRVRAVQDFSPSAAIAPVFLLKRAVKAELGADLQRQPLLAELLDFDSRIDAAVLLSFDIFMQCKQKIFDIRVNESSKRSAILLDRLNRVFGNQESDADLEDTGSDHVSRGSTR